HTFRLTEVHMHLHLPSFPTRRSSDLGVVNRDSKFIKVSTSASEADPSVMNVKHVLEGGVDGYDDVTPDNINTAMLKFDNVETIKDRKSTRLNSSHVKISYAVFCLKKK